MQRIGLFSFSQALLQRIFVLTVFSIQQRYNQISAKVCTYSQTGGMLLKTVIYLDALLLVNFLIAYFLLQAVALFCGKDLSFWRSTLGAGIAALSTLILLAPELPCFLSILFKAGSAFIVVLSAFGFCGWRPFLRQFVWFFLLNIGLAGLVLLAVTHGGFSGMEINNLTVYIDVSPLLLLFCSLAVYTSLRFILFFSVLRNRQNAGSSLLLLTGPRCLPFAHCMTPVFYYRTL